MRQFFRATTVFCLVTLSLAQQAQDHLTLQRTVNGQTVSSKDSPAATLTFEDDFKYVGGQRFLLYGVADAEQHFFAHAAKDGAVDRFYWVQFEHYLPDNSYSYNYNSAHTVQIGGLPFLADTEGYRDFGGANSRPDSDGTRARQLFAQHGLTFPKKAARIRMVHLPSPDHRSELMIIYGEALPDSSAVSFSEDGIPIDEKYPAIVQAIRDHALRGLKIKTQ